MIQDAAYELSKEQSLVGASTVVGGPAGFAASFRSTNYVDYNLINAHGQTQFIHLRFDTGLIDGVVNPAIEVFLAYWLDGSDPDTATPAIFSVLGPSLRLESPLGVDRGDGADIYIPLSAAPTEGQLPPAVGNYRYVSLIYGLTGVAAQGAVTARLVDAPATQPSRFASPQSFS
ncbi:MAG: hypothetical protein HRT82_16310 [Henriciella sp.]|nr:hypothetical protein [Henriciella sp.]